MVSEFSCFVKWHLPLWQWIGAVAVAPITFIVVPFYVGFTEGDWSLVAVWAISTIVCYALNGFRVFSEE